MTIGRVPTGRNGKIILNGMKYGARIGSTAEERAFAQTIAIDVEMKLELSMKLLQGDLQEGICWAETDLLLRYAVESKEWVLAEQLADHLITALFERFPLTRSVLVRVKKTPFPHGDWVGVEIERSR